MESCFLVASQILADSGRVSACGDVTTCTHLQNGLSSLGWKICDISAYCAMKISQLYVIVLKTDMQPTLCIQHYEISNLRRSKFFID